MHISTRAWKNSYALESHLFKLKKPNQQIIVDYKTPGLVEQDAINWDSMIHDQLPYLWWATLCAMHNLLEKYHKYLEKK